MSNLNKYDYKNLTPFKWFVLQNFPFIEADFDAITNYQLFCKVVEYLNNTINSVNNIGQEVETLSTEFINLKNYVDNYFKNLDVQDEINNKLDEMAESGELTELLMHYFNSDKSLIDLTNKTNKLAGASWNYENWTPVANGFHHDTGHNTALSCNVSGITNGKCYVLKFTCTNQYASTLENALLVEFGGSGTWEQYQNDGTVTKYFTFYPENNELIFTPSTNWEGDLLNIALYELEDSDILPQTLRVFDENDNVSFSTIITNAELKNLSISNNALNKSTLGSKYNIAIGDNVLNRTASGYYNTAIGYNSQNQSINGTRNVSVGYNSLREVTYGDRNVAIGTFALHHITKGRNNIGIGADTAWNTTTGNNNIAISNGALNSNTTGSQNIALGYFANGSNTTGGNNISVGYLANSANTSGVYNIALGYFSHYKGQNDKFNIAIGHQLMTENNNNLQCEYNITLGYQAMNKANGSYNIALGYQALKNTTNQSNYNITLGYDVMSGDVTSPLEGDNIVIGHSSGRKLAGHNNITLGRGALNDTATNYNISIGNSSLKNCKGNSNVAIGLNAGDYIGNVDNTICIGANAHGINRTNSVVIGNIIKYNGEFKTMALNGLDPIENAILYLDRGTENKVPIKLRSGTLKTIPEVGGIEFDGSHIYITNSSGVRKQLAEV